MDNKAQVSIEYLIVVALLIAVAGFVGLLASNLATLKGSISKDVKSYSERLVEMMEW